MKKHLQIIIIAVIFICGLSLFLYPALSNLYNQHLNNLLIKEYEASFSNITTEQFSEAMNEAITYNQNLQNKKVLKKFDLKYENVLNLNDDGVMGYIEIPKINASLIIYHTINDNVLHKGIGHVSESHLPVGGINTHCVLAGHTGLPSAKLLTNMDHMEIGDSFYIHVLNKVLEYKVDNISVVEPYETSGLNVIKDKDCVTIVTCTPYGVNSHRLLVRGVRVNNSDLSSNDYGIFNKFLNIDKNYLISLSVIGILIITISIIKIIKIYKRKINTVKKGGDKTNENNT